VPTRKCALNDLSMLDHPERLDGSRQAHPTASARESLLAFLVLAAASANPPPSGWLGIARACTVGETNRPHRRPSPVSQGNGVNKRPRVPLNR
jgi:hypothetical protein